MATRSFKEKLADLQALYDNITPHLTGIPQLAKDHEALAPLLAEARALQSQQDVAKGQLKTTNLRRFEIEKLTDDLRNRLTATAKGALGPNSGQLHEFGITPRALIVRRPRRSKAELAAAQARKAARAQAQAAAADAVKAANRARAEAAVKLVP
ncbi:MAG TPA: hypothetical protein VOA87_01150 [Thermoanaerobaculia bacterium]|nr:hypothetical protein [Thermoanaerobaculia bacterium]